MQAPVVRQHQEHVEDLEPDGRHRKEVDGNHGLDKGFTSFDSIPFVIKRRVA
jgi:hypothetical protein